MSSQDYAASHGFSISKRAGPLVYFSGQIGLGPDGAPPDCPAEQFRIAFEVLREALSAEQLTPDDLVELLTFHVDFPRHMEDFVAAKANFLEGALPAWTAIGVSAVGVPGSLAEIRAVALAQA